MSSKCRVGAVQIHVFNDPEMDRAEDLESLWRSTANLRLRDLERLHSRVYGQQVFIPDLLKESKDTQQDAFGRLAQLLRDLVSTSASINHLGIVTHDNSWLINKKKTIQLVAAGMRGLTIELREVVKLLVEQIESSQLGVVTCSSNELSKLREALVVIEIDGVYSCN